MSPPLFLNSGRNCDPSRISETSCVRLRLEVVSRTRVTGPLAPSASLQRWWSTTFHPDESLRKQQSASFVSLFNSTLIVESFGADWMRGK